MDIFITYEDLSQSQVSVKYNAAPRGGVPEISPSDGRGVSDSKMTSVSSTLFPLSRSVYHGGAERG